MPATEKTFQQNRYRIVQCFGRSKTNTIYEAYDNILKANVVINEFVNSERFVSPPQQQARKAAFVEKARVLTALNNEFLPRVYDYFCEDEHYCLVVELIDGNDLGSLLETRKATFSLAEAAAWAEQLLDALNCLHRNIPPLIHRDIKPQNVKLSEEGKIKLMALGGVEIYNSKANTENSALLSETAALPYQPLEQIWRGLDAASQKVILHSLDERSEKILEQPPDARSDIYALGATFYYLLTGQIPADALARSIDIMDGNADPLLPPEQLNSNIPTGISNIIMRAMEIRRENRFDSAVIMRQVLRTALVRAREVEAAKSVGQIPAISEEAKLAEQTHLEQEKQEIERKRLELEAEKQKLDEDRRLIQQKELEFQAEQQKQVELLKQQRQEAEQKKIPAEQFAVQAAIPEPEKLETIEDTTPPRLNAEILNFDNEVAENIPAQAAAENIVPEKVSDTAVFLPETIISESNVQKLSESKVLPVFAVEKFDSQNNSNEDFGKLFSEPAQNNQTFKKMSAAAGALVILGGAIFGIWFMNTARTSVNGQNTPAAMSASETAKPAPTIQPIAETTPETAVEKSPEAEPIQVNQTQTIAPTVKNKQVASAINEPATPKAQKQTAPAVKSAAPTVQKKAVTVDDIINDN